MPATEGASDLNLGLTHAIDGFAGNEHALPVTPPRNDIITLFATSRTSLVPTLSVQNGGEPGFSNLIIERQPQKDPKFAHFVPPGIVSEKVRLYEAATLDEVWPRERALPRLWFH